MLFLFSFFFVYSLYIYRYLASCRYYYSEWIVILITAHNKRILRLIAYELTKRAVWPKGYDNVRNEYTATDGSTVGYDQNLSIAYFKSLPY